MRARSIDEIGAGDIVVGQRWYEVVTHARDVWTVTALSRDTATMRKGSGEQRDVDFGGLLSRWVLLDDRAA